MQGVKINGLGLAMISIAIASLGTAFGQAHIDPVAGSVAGALKTAEVDESLRRVANLYPQVSYNMGIAIKQGSEGFGD